MKPRPPTPRLKPPRAYDITCLNGLFLATIMQGPLGKA